MTQGKKIEYWKTHSSLFQHVGIFRSLGGFQTLQEKKFGKGPLHPFVEQTVNVMGLFTESAPHCFSKQSLFLQ